MLLAIAKTNVTLIFAVAVAVCLDLNIVAAGVGLGGAGYGRVMVQARLEDGLFGLGRVSVLLMLFCEPSLVQVPSKKKQRST